MSWLGGVEVDCSDTAEVLEELQVPLQHYALVYSLKDDMRTRLCVQRHLHQRCRGCAPWAATVQHLHAGVAGIDGCTYGTCLFTEIEVEEGEGAETGPAA